MKVFKRLWHHILVWLHLCDAPAVPEYGWAYFDHMLAVYLTLNINDERASAVIEKAAQRPYGITWGDIFLLENLILSHQADDTIMRNAWIQRERFREMAGPRMYERYLASGVPTETDTPQKMGLLRADLSRLLDFLHWYYELISIRERSRKNLTIQCICWVIIYTVVLTFSLISLRAHNHNFIALLVCVVYFGIIGGFVSSQRRMENIPCDGDPLIGVFGFNNANYYLWLSPLLGAIFAGVLTLFLMGGIVQGTVFPTFVKVAVDKPESGSCADGAKCTRSPSDCVEPVGHSIFSQARVMLPDRPEDYAKLFIWCFLAGFAERLVPDSLDRLASKLDTANQSSNPTPKTAASPHTNGDTGGAVGQNTQLTSDTLNNAMHSGGNG